MLKLLLQLKPQVAPAQVAVPFEGAVQAFPQLPQCATVFWRLTQSPPQFVKPLLQVKPQLPFEHEALAFGLVVVQPLPQLPQLLTSLFRL